MARRYDLGRRAEKMEETRRRIVDATLGLHSEVGPAATTISAIAERAGVSRPTVYSQFPDDRSLFSACGARFNELHPFPSLEGDTGTVLRTLYRHYTANRGMLSHVDRDARAIPALAEVMGPVWAYLDAAAERLGEGNASRRALLRVAVELGTWQRLDAEGLSPGRAAVLMARAVACAGRR